MIRPIDHTSLFVVYFSYLKICGDIYKGVPTAEFSIWFLKLCKLLANPKSANFNKLLWIRMF